MAGKKPGFTNFANLAMYARVGKKGKLQLTTKKKAPMITFSMAHNSGPSTNRAVTWINFIAYNEIATWVAENVEIGKSLYVTKASPRARSFKLPDGRMYYDTQWVVWEIDAREQGVYQYEENY